MKTILTMFSFLVMTGFAFAQTPSIVNITPNQGQRGQTLNLQITGSQTNFAQGSNIAVTVFNAATAIRANSVAVLSGTNLIANITIPQNANYQKCQVSVGGSGIPFMSKAEAFTVVNSQGVIPKIKSYTPESATNGQTLDLTITGEGTTFMQATQIQAGFFAQASSITVNSVNAINDTTVVTNVTIGPTVSNGYYAFYVDVAQEGRLYNPGRGLLVYQPGGAPQIVSVSPHLTTVGQTLDLTITGVNIDFTQASGTYNAYFFKGATQLSCLNTSVISANQIKTTLSIPINWEFTGYYNLVLRETPADHTIVFDNALYIGPMTTSIKEAFKPTSNIYPNPTRDELFIDTEHKIISFGLMNTTGQLVAVKPEDLEEQPNGYRISTLKYGLPPGFYFIRIQTIEGYTYHKILIN